VSLGVREVLRYPHPALHSPAAPVADPASVAALAGDLIATMRSFPRCVGIAAPQVGEAVRLCVVDCSGHPKAERDHGLLVLVNPVLVPGAETEIGREGCLSIPDLTANVRRALRVRVDAVTPAGEPIAVESEGFEARAIQHEVDHLDGLLFLDRVVNPATDVFLRRRRG
jgi:peptide deformylase